MKRKKLAEWWEIWWVKPGHPQIRVQAGDPGVPKDERVLPVSFGSRKRCWAYVRRIGNRYWRVRHVVRYARPRLERAKETKR